MPSRSYPILRLRAAETRIGKRLGRPTLKYSWTTKPATSVFARPVHTNIWAHSPEPGLSRWDFTRFNLGIAPHTPRLRCGRVIVQRRTWTLKSEEFPQGNYTGVSRDLVVAVEQLRAEKNWPRYVFIRPTEQALRRSGAEGRDKDTKPVFVDLESYLFLEIFYRWLIKAGELEITEMLPDPDHLLWREPDGRRTFELRTLIVPRQ